MSATTLPVTITHKRQTRGFTVRVAPCRECVFTPVRMFEDGKSCFFCRNFNCAAFWRAPVWRATEEEAAFLWNRRNAL